MVRVTSPTSSVPGGRSTLPPSHLSSPTGVSDRGGPAGEDLGDLARGHALLPLLDGNAPLDGLEAQVLGHVEDRVARDPLKDGAGELGGEQLAALGDEEQVHAAELFDVGVSARVQEDGLVAVVPDALELAGEAGGVVAAAFGRARAAFAGPGVVQRQPQP